MKLPYESLIKQLQALTQDNGDLGGQIKLGNLTVDVSIVGISKLTPEVAELVINTIACIPLAKQLAAAELETLYYDYNEGKHMGGTAIADQLEVELIEVMPGGNWMEDEVHIMFDDKGLFHGNIPEITLVDGEYAGVAIEG